MNPHERAEAAALRAKAADFADRHPNWTAHANCAGIDPDLFFPAKGALSRSDQAALRALCGDCTVRSVCLEWAQTAPLELRGWWGGLSAKERQTARRHLAIRNPGAAS